MKELLDRLLKIAKIDSVEARWTFSCWTLYAKVNWRMYHIFLEDRLMPLTFMCDEMSSREEAAKFLINAVIESGKSAIIDEFQNYDLGTCKKWTIVPKASSIEELEIWADMHEADNDK